MATGGKVQVGNCLGCDLGLALRRVYVLAHPPARPGPFIHYAPPKLHMHITRGIRVPPPLFKWRGFLTSGVISGLKGNPGKPCMAHQGSSSLASLPDIECNHPSFPHPSLPGSKQDLLKRCPTRKLRNQRLRTRKRW